MKTIVLISGLVIMTNLASAKQIKSFYDFKTTTIDVQPFDLSTLKGKKVLVVNVASKCGNPPQYTELQQLYQKYGGVKFTIIGFHANNFFYQEPGTNAQIKELCTKNYGVTFPMMSKISVKGKNQDPIYKWLTNKAENGVMDAPVTWNFQKFMIDENGNLVGTVTPKTSPMNERIVNWIEGKK